MTSRTDQREIRLRTAALLLVVAVAGTVRSSFAVFSGDTTAYARFVLTFLCWHLIFAALAAVAMVVVTSLLWKGTKWQAGVAAIFWMLGALILFLSVGGIRSLH